MTITEDDSANNKHTEKVLSTSTWINQAFLEDILTKTSGENVQIDNHEVSPAVGVGDNYLSILYKTKVNYRKNGKPKTENLMIKGFPSAKILQDMVEEMGIFKKEINMYTKVLPAMQRHCQETFPDEDFAAPHAYTCSRENTLVMEDLGESGYKMANRQAQLDYDHCVITLKALARFHALSVKVCQEAPDLVDTVKIGEFFIEPNREKMAPYLEQCFRVVGKEFEKASGPESRFALLLKDIGDCIWEKGCRLVEPSNNFNVLNHGDLWVNNVMYKYNNEGQPKSVKFVDYQLIRHSTPAIDLLYFFFSSPQPDVLAIHFTDFVRIYHEALSADLATLNLNIDYTLDDLHEDIRDRCCFAFVVMVQILPIIVANAGDALDMDNIDLEAKPDDEAPMLKNYRYPRYKEIVTKLLEVMEKLGYTEEAKNRMQPIVAEARAKAAEANSTEEKS